MIKLQRGESKTSFAKEYEVKTIQRRIATYHAERRLGRERIGKRHLKLEPEKWQK